MGKMATKRFGNLALVTSSERESIAETPQATERQSGIRMRTIEPDPESTPQPSDPSRIVFTSLLWYPGQRPLLP